MFSTFGALLFSSTTLTSVLAATAGGFDDGGNTLVSAMMMFLGNEDSVYILDKAELNAAQVNGHPAWGSLWDVKTHKAAVMDIKTNSFCASGMHLPNGSYVTFGGNDAVTEDGKPGSQKNEDGTGAWDSFYQDFDGRRSIRIVKPCKIADSLNSGDCKWFDEPEQLAMKKRRWYSMAEPTAEGQVVIIGGMVNGGYINRWLPNDDPVTERGQAEPTYEYFPPKNGDPQQLQFIIRTSGLNVYPHAFLMPSGKMLLQANLSTILWDHVNNVETPLPDMPNGVIRVYPASGAVAMLPLTPANNWTPTVLFCGGSAIADQDWGDYTGPRVDTFNIPASADCQRLTPEPSDGSQPAYEKDDDMVEPRTMGQIVILPNGKLLLLNGGQKGTAGYAISTPNTPEPQMPFGRSLASEPVLKPVIYDPNAPKGSRWTTQGLSASSIPRLYHSTAVLLPDASVIAAGSNPNPDVNLSTVFPTEYRADIFYPPYFSAKTRPAPQNLPKTLSYGGDSFDITLPSTSYTGNANDAANATIVTIVRSGFTTHAMNMGQRFMQLNNTFTVNKDGSITLHVAQPPPNPNLFQPGPALLFVCVNDIPSTGKFVIVGNGNIGPQPTSAASQLPANVRFDGTFTSSGDGSSSSSAPSSSPSKTILIAGIAGALVLLGVIGVVAGVCLARRKRRAVHAKPTYPLDGLKPTGFGSVGGMLYNRTSSSAESTDFAPLTKQKGGVAGVKGEYNDWDSSTANLHAPYLPYNDDGASSTGHGGPAYSDYDPYPAYGIVQQHSDSMSNVNLGPPLGIRSESPYSADHHHHQQQQLQQYQQQQRWSQQSYDDDPPPPVLPSKESWSSPQQHQEPPSTHQLQQGYQASRYR